MHILFHSTNYFNAILTLICIIILEKNWNICSLSLSLHPLCSDFLCHIYLVSISLFAGMVQISIVKRIVSLWYTHIIRNMFFTNKSRYALNFMLQPTPWSNDSASNSFRCQQKALRMGIVVTLVSRVETWTHYQHKVIQSHYQLGLPNRMWSNLRGNSWNSTFKFFGKKTKHSIIDESYFSFIITLHRPHAHR